MTPSSPPSVGLYEKTGVECVSMLLLTPEAAAQLSDTLRIALASPESASLAAWPREICAFPVSAHMWGREQYVSFHLDAGPKQFQIIIDRFAGFQAQCLNVHVDCCSGSLYPSLSARSVIPESKFTTPGSSGYWRFSSMAAIPSAAGLPNRSMKPSSPPSSSHPNLRPESTQLRPAQTERARTIPARRPPLLLPAHSHSRCAPVPLLSQASLRSARQ